MVFKLDVVHGNKVWLLFSVNHLKYWAIFFLKLATNLFYVLYQYMLYFDTSQEEKVASGPKVTSQEYLSQG